MVVPWMSPRVVSGTGTVPLLILDTLDWPVRAMRFGQPQGIGAEQVHSLCRIWNPRWRTQISAESLTYSRLLSGFGGPDTLCPTIGICVPGQHLGSYIRFLWMSRPTGPSLVIMNKVLLAHNMLSHCPGRAPLLQ